MAEQRTGIGGRARDVLDDAVHRPGRSVGDRWRRVRGNGLLLVQTGIGAGLAWWVALELVGHRTPAPFFSPISAVIVLGISSGQRLRRTGELILGVALGILVGDLVVGLIGGGAWQLALIVPLAMAAAMFVGSGGPLITHAGSSAVLLATLYPPGSGAVYTRWLDALIGGVIEFAVHALLLPLNPVTPVRKAAGEAFDALSGGLADVARALRTEDEALAAQALEDLRGTDDTLKKFRDALAVGGETASVAPIRWRHRQPLVQYAEAVDHVDHAVRNARVLARRAHRALISLYTTGEQRRIDAGGPAPEPEPAGGTAGAAVEHAPTVLADAVGTLAEAVDALHRELDRDEEPDAARELAVEAARRSAAAYVQGVGFSTAVVVAQVQSCAFDLLRATGLDEEVARKVIREVRRG